MSIGKGKVEMKNSFAQCFPAFGVYRTKLFWRLRLCHLANEGFHWPSFPSTRVKRVEGPHLGLNLKAILDILILEDKLLIPLPAGSKNSSMKLTS